MNATPETVMYSAVLNVYREAEAMGDVDAMRACMQAARGDLDASELVCEYVNGRALVRGKRPDQEVASAFFAALDEGAEPVELALRAAAVEAAMYRGEMRSLTSEEARVLSAFHRGRAVGEIV